MSSLASHQAQWMRFQMASSARSGAAGNRNGFCPLGKTWRDCFKCREVFSCWGNNRDCNIGYFHLLQVKAHGLKTYIWHFGYLQLASLDSSSYCIQGKVLKCSALHRYFGLGFLNEPFFMVVSSRDLLSDRLCGVSEASTSSNSRDTETDGLPCRCRVRLLRYTSPAGCQKHQHMNGIVKDHIVPKNDRIVACLIDIFKF